MPPKIKNKPLCQKAGSWSWYDDKVTKMSGDEHGWMNQLNDGDLNDIGGFTSSLAFPDLLEAHTAAPATFT